MFSQLFVDGCKVVHHASAEFFHCSTVKTILLSLPIAIVNLKQYPVKEI